ncbi:hypothetical protein MesoLj131c_62660 [Mesorhizobium sp. 131-3-5]|jgi:hypothetical protein|uniref:hypothetical protein n=1 Tax=Mesorhizobium sp. 131-3-5 TaxID=2744520 RepID=UPI0019258CD8|nr:hypothetical protein [Mesorhizobium sp. 131-3-5]BCH12008.1 hypothetical protein MesoLj131c_62660 [Mesorhizobium sp. 131-3-5]
MTPIEFAQRCARIASRASAWAGDVLDTSTEKPARREDVERFITEMRERLNYIEEKLNG